MNNNVSVIVSAYNQSEKILLTMRQLYEQAHETDITCQVIVADDGSTAGEVGNFLSKTNEKQRSSNFSVNYVWQEDLGFRLASSLNNGLRLATSSIIIMLNGDCVPEKDFLKYHLLAHSASEDKLICVGHRQFKANTLLTKEVTDAHGLAVKEEMEAFTIEKKSKSSTPWRAVIGRNFSFRTPSTPILFDHRFFGWGGDDFGFALDLYNAGYRNVLFERRAVVTQNDDLRFTNNPLENCNQSGIAYAQANHLLLMKKNLRHAETYIELSRFLGYFVVPFDFTGSSFVLNIKKRDAYLAEFSNESGLSLEHANHLYGSALNNLQRFFKANPDIKQHPAMEFLLLPDRNPDNPILIRGASALLPR